MMSVHIFAVVIALAMVAVIAGSAYVTAKHTERNIKK